jgi:hypothetical protein
MGDDAGSCRWFEHALGATPAADPAVDRRNGFLADGAAEMRGFLKEHSGVFGPDEVHILVAASIKHGRRFKPAA